MLGELQQRAGGNPFDNRDVIYESADDYNALNRGAKRYMPPTRGPPSTFAPGIRRPASCFIPMLAIHTTYDPLVPARIPAMYPGITELAGAKRQLRAGVRRA
jgi:hypothetical protein